MTWFDGGVITLELKTAQTCHKKKCLQEEACGPPSWSSKPTWTVESPWVQCWPSSPNLTGWPATKMLPSPPTCSANKQQSFDSHGFMDLCDADLLDQLLHCGEGLWVEAEDRAGERHFIFQTIARAIGRSNHFASRSHISRPSSSSASCSQQPWKRLTCTTSNWHAELITDAQNF